MEEINKKRQQTILSNSKENLNSLKLSENGKILSCCNLNVLNYNKIYFYIYSGLNKQNGQYNFSLINKIQLKHDIIIDYEISNQSNLCIVISKII